LHRTTEHFWKCFEYLLNLFKKTAKKNFELLKSDPSHPSLHFKKVGAFWSIRGGMNYRALAVEDGKTLFRFGTEPMTNMKE
jgi:hypothetical protein